MKKITAVLLSVFVLISLFSLSAFAVEEKPIDEAYNEAIEDWQNGESIYEIYEESLGEVLGTETESFYPMFLVSVVCIMLMFPLFAVVIVLIVLVSKKRKSVKNLKNQLNSMQFAVNPQMQYPYGQPQYAPYGANQPYGTYPAAQPQYQPVQPVYPAQAQPVAPQEVQFQEPEMPQEPVAPTEPSEANYEERGEVK